MGSDNEPMFAESLRFRVLLATLSGNGRGAMVDAVFALRYTRFTEPICDSCTGSLDVAKGYGLPFDMARCCLDEAANAEALGDAIFLNLDPLQRTLTMSSLCAGRSSKRTAPCLAMMRAATRTPWPSTPPRIWRNRRTLPLATTMPWIAFRELRSTA